jgi:hypothetical protein
MKRILVCGGRDFTDAERICRELDYVREHVGGISMLIHGNARGADKLAGCWAESHGIAVMVFPANWARHGKAAGPIRNSLMLAEGYPDLVVAFPGGAGTANMVQQANEAGVPVMEIAK